VVVGGALINVHARWGALGNALAVFNEFMTGDLVVWNSIIGAFAQNSVGDEASFLFKKMKRAGFQAEQATLTSTLRAVTSSALLELGRQVLVHVLKYDQDLILNNAFYDMYCKCDGLADARLVFSHMKGRDVITLSTTIAQLAQNGFIREALELFEKMKLTGPRPNYFTIAGALFPWSHGDLLKGRMVLFMVYKEALWD